MASKQYYVHNVIGSVSYQVKVYFYLINMWCCLWKVGRKRRLLAFKDARYYFVIWLRLLIYVILWIQSLFWWINKTFSCNSLGLPTPRCSHYDYSYYLHRWKFHSHLHCRNICFSDCKGHSTCIGVESPKYHVGLRKPSKNIQPLFSALNMKQSGSVTLRHIELTKIVRNNICFSDVQLGQIYVELNS